MLYVIKKKKDNKPKSLKHFSEISTKFKQYLDRKIHSKLRTFTYVP